MPARVARGRQCWFVWFIVTGGQGRIFKLAIIPSP
jgi:hypothetical protein